MKKIKSKILLTALAVLFVVSQVSAGTGELNWLTDYNKAKEVAHKKGLPILVDFTGSDWCIWCIRLDENILSKKEFIKYANENLVLLKLDFPRKTVQPAELKKANNELAAKYGVRGFPTVLLLDKTGKEVGRTGYQDMTPAEYVKHIESFVKK
ncbi:MAG: thioredoxin family protein [Melioribacteraceae bacterium]|nr:thioredoxin family protein [Melioribacteraceae bacterium]